MARTSTPSPATAGRMLFPGKVVRLVAGPHGAVLHGRQGSLWATVDGEWSPADHIIEPGEALRVAPNTAIWVSAVDARRGLACLDWMPVQVRRPARGRAWQQLWMALEGRWATRGALAA
jgi:hypothetical protein